MVRPLCLLSLGCRPVRQLSCPRSGPRARLRRCRFQLPKGLCYKGSDEIAVPSGFHQRLQPRELECSLDRHYDRQYGSDQQLAGSAEYSARAEVLLLIAISWGRRCKMPAPFLMSRVVSQVLALSLSLSMCSGTSTAQAAKQTATDPSALAEKGIHLAESGR